MTATIALLTDFGTLDSYVGMIKGVIIQVAPSAPIIDITHAIPSGNIRRAAFELWRSAAYFPSNTIFVAVVDPGVGTARRPIALKWQERIYIGPDNGLFFYLLVGDEPVYAVELKARKYRLEPVSNTFHGRDIFAPAAAHLAQGVSLEKCGPSVEDIVRLPLPLLEVSEGPMVKGEVLNADQFGNLITSIGHLHRRNDEVVLDPWLPNCPPAQPPLKRSRLQLQGDVNLGLSTTYGDLPNGEAVAYIGSAGLLEIAITGGCAADALALSEGQEISFGLKG